MYCAAPANTSKLIKTVSPIVRPVVLASSPNVKAMGAYPIAMLIPDCTPFLTSPEGLPTASSAMMLTA